MGKRKDKKKKKKEGKRQNLCEMSTWALCTNLLFVFSLQFSPPNFLPTIYNKKSPFSFFLKIHPTKRIISVRMCKACSRRLKLRPFPPFPMNWYL